MDKKEYALNSLVQMKKKHPCGGNEWKVIRLGADVRIKCLTCLNSILFTREEFEKKIKKILKKEADDKV